MPLEEYEKSQPLSDKKRELFRIAIIKYAFTDIMELFEEAIIQLAWDVYYAKRNEPEAALYEANKEIMSKYINESDAFSISGLQNMIDPAATYTIHKTFHLPIELPIFSDSGSRSHHSLSIPATSKYIKRRDALNRDIEIFNKRIREYRKDLQTALESVRSTKQFIGLYPDYEGYMKAALKKFYYNRFPELIQNLKSSTSLEVYTSIVKPSSPTWCAIPSVPLAQPVQQPIQAQPTQQPTTQTQRQMAGTTASQRA